MNVENLAQFSNQKYLNLVTYRKSGTAVSTPLWFIEDRGVLYVRTPAKSGKVKRLRNNRPDERGSHSNTPARIVARTPGLLLQRLRG